ncbi:MAG: RNA-binding transcriptional accessory protein [Bdellovibrionales bacterium]|nr:RNA-binding transcriptional accessory protein [Bdellovibrionales bacterium]
MNFESWFSAQQPAISLHSAAAVLELTAEGSTVPFIARYRKERTGNLDEVGIRAVISAKENWDEIVKRQLFILKEVDKQGKLTDPLRDKILATFHLESLEDIYLPYKLKRKTKAMVAKEAGLEPLSEWVWNTAHGTAVGSETLEAQAAALINAEKKLPDVAAVLQGVQDILTERLSETIALRESVRAQLFGEGGVICKKGEKAKTPSQYENYFDYSESVKSLQEPRNSHRYLALRRGWTEGELSVVVGGAPGDATFEDKLLLPFLKEAGAEAPSPGQAILVKAARMSLKAHVFPAIETEVHKALKEGADQAAINVFSENLEKLLLSAPFGPKAVLGVDPGLRTGCKLAVIESSGRFASHDVMHLQASEGEKAKAAEKILRLVKTYNVRAVAVGNGTAGRETEAFVRETLRKAELDAVPVVMVSESGASVYSASEIARAEFPDLDVTVKGAISIARRLQDPLAELVKVDPKSIGVGQYQHDVSPTALKRSLEATVDSCVNKVGVNLNTASEHLLARVSGIGNALAKAIVEHRGNAGLFKSREQLLEVSRFTKKAFEQAAGFLRIPEGDNPLDNTGVHPERYLLLEELARKLSKDIRQLVGEGAQLVKQADDFRQEVGEFTFQDIVSDLEKPGRDPRDQFVPFSFLETIHEVTDLKPGLVAPGIVTNVTNFGAFVDIGVHQDGLVHISQLADRFVKDPREVVQPGDRVQVRVLEVNLEKKQISLSMRTEGAPARREERRDDRGDHRRPGPSGGRPQHGGGGRPGGSAPRRDDRSGGPRGPQPHAQPRRENKPFVLDPRSPFAKLAALRNELAKPGSDKKK